MSAGQNVVTLLHLADTGERPDTVRVALTPQLPREQREYERARHQAERLLESGSVDAVTEALIAAKRGRKRVRPPVETPDYVRGLARQVKALVRRVGENADVEALAEVVALGRVVEEVQVATVAALRSGEQPYSWADIARVLGMTRQAAQEKYKVREPGQPKRVRVRG